MIKNHHFLFIIYKYKLPSIVILVIIQKKVYQFSKFHNFIYTFLILSFELYSIIINFYSENQIDEYKQEEKR